MKRYLVHPDYCAGFGAIVRFHGVSPGQCIDASYSPNIEGLRNFEHFVHLHSDCADEYVDTPGYLAHHKEALNRRRHLPRNQKLYDDIKGILDIAHANYLKGLRTYTNYKVPAIKNEWHFKIWVLYYMGRKSAPHTRIQLLKDRGLDSEMNIVQFEYIKFVPHWPTDPHYANKP